MKVVLTDALHARPANLLVRLVAQHAAEILITMGDRRADARKILDVLALGAHKGDIVDITAVGDEAEAVLAAIRELVERGFNADLVPELGAAAVEGIAIGKAWVLEEVRPSPHVRGTIEEESERVLAAVARAERDVAALVRALPEEEAMLFEPEIAILRDMKSLVLATVAGGASAEEAVMELTVVGVPDLVLDARTRLLDALARPETAPQSARARAGIGEGGQPAAAAEHVLVAESLVPSTVAMLPSTVTGIVVSMDDATAAAEPPGAHTIPTPGVGYTSHAAILARSRSIPILYVPPHIVAGVAPGDMIVLDTTISPARLWVDPSSALIAEARARRDARARAAAEDDERTTARLALGLIVRANVGSSAEAIPPGAEGVGLVRTELVFAGRALPPSEAEQFATLIAIARHARGEPVNVRLFDAGGDKPVDWISPPDDDPDARGIALLFHHPDLLNVQLHAIERAREHENVRILLPLVRSANDVAQVRSLLRRAMDVGAMIETPEAAQAIDAIAHAADFICIGTNDLTASTLGIPRGAAAMGHDPRVLRLIEHIVARSHALGCQVTVCGEMAADVLGARVLRGLGVDAISVAPNRISPIKRALSADTIEGCRAAAAEALSDTLA